MRHATLVRAVLVLAVMLAASGCTSAPDRPPPLSGTLTLFASTSLSETFHSMADGFETAYPQVNVEVVLAADAELARRSAAGPAPDLLAVEGPEPLAAAGPMGTPVNFARNQLVLAVPAGNPKGLFQLADIGRPDLRVALCADSEPCGRVATAVLAAGHVPVPASANRVSDVRAALSQVSGGAADVALVYRSDARLAGDTVATIEVPESRTALAEYQAAVSRSAANPRAAEAFLAYLTSPSTLDALVSGGFQPPA